MSIVGGIYLLIISIVFGGLGVRELKMILGLFLRGVVTRGRIVELRKESRMASAGTFFGRITVYDPIVEFVSQSGDVIRFVGGGGSSMNSNLLIGREVLVRYQAGDPKGTARLWRIRLFFGAVVLLGIAIATAILALKRLRISAF